MNILFVTGEFPPMQGGVGDYTRELALALLGPDCRVHVLTSAHGGPVAGMEVHPIVRRWNWKSWGQVLGLVRSKRIDLVHIQYQAAAYGMHPAVNLLPRFLRRQKAGRPSIVVTFHDLLVPYLFPKAGPVRRWVVSELARRCDAAITTNRKDYCALSQVLPVPPALIPIGSNIAPQLPAGYQRSAWRERWGAGPDDLLVCFFGFVNARKGVDTLVRALALLAQGPEHTHNPRLLMIGGQTGASDPTNVGCLAEIRELVERLGLEERVRWTGYLPSEQVSAAFDASDVCALPFRDGASLLHGTLHAALAHGAAIVTTRPHDALPELVDRDTVLLVRPEDPAALAGALLEVKGDAELRRRLGEGARNLSARYRWDAIAAETMELYRRIAPR